MGDSGFPRWKLTLWLGVAQLVGSYNVAFFACTRYTAKPYTCHDSVPSILPQAHAWTPTQPGQLDSRQGRLQPDGDTTAALKSQGMPPLLGWATTPHVA